MMVKQGVGFVELHPALRHGLLIMEEESIKETGKGCVVTALGDGIHSSQSLHYGIRYQGRKALEADDRCRAADVRTKDYTQEQREKIEEKARRRLGPDFDLIYEAPPKQPHWHLEYDPADE